MIKLLIESITERPTGAAWSSQGASPRCNVLCTYCIVVAEARFRVRKVSLAMPPQHELETKTNQSADASGKQRAS